MAAALKPAPVVQIHTPEEDDDTIFCKTLLREMQQVTEPRTKVLLRMKLYSIVMDARMGLFAVPIQPSQPTYINLQPSTSSGLMQQTRQGIESNDLQMPTSAVLNSISSHPSDMSDTQ